MSALTIDIDTLTELTLEQLRTSWRKHYGPAPSLRSPELMRLMLAWRLQADAHGGLDAVTRRQLKRTGPLECEGRALGVGARLTREWQGVRVEVVVTESGFECAGTTYKSLSAVATAIAGTRWNGPRFFGLRVSVLDQKGANHRAPTRRAMPLRNCNGNALQARASA